MSDKVILSANGRQRSAPVQRSDEDVTEAIGRLIQALGRRCADGDPDTANHFRYLQSELDEALAISVAGWRAHGFSDGEIGRELGVTKQAVAQRWPRSTAGGVCESTARATAAAPATRE